MWLFSISHQIIRKNSQENLEDVLILEDDAIQVNNIPIDYPKDGIFYVGGFIYNRKMMDDNIIIMGSITGLRKGAFTSIDNSGEIRLGPSINSGTVGQALVSGGPNQPAQWGIHTGTINPLTMGSNVSLLSGNPSFDGSIADTLNSVDTTYQGGTGITNIDIDKLTPKPRYKLMLLKCPMI
jgi:hypothetical protein